MAARRITQASSDWAAFAKKVPEEQIAQFNAFKSKSDGYAARVASLPKDLPAINWTQYEGRVSVPNMVAEFQKQYQALTVPYPKDVYTSKIDEQEKATMIAVEEFVKKMQASVVSMKAELAKVEAMMPITEMNLEEYFDAFPNHALDSFERPTMWPHIEECQPEYLERMAKEGKFDEAH